MWENIYYDPEKFGVRKVDEFDLSSGSYEFDYVVVWQSLVNSDVFYLGKDSGCSCPSPFESISSIDNVNELERLNPENPEPQIRAAFDLDRGWAYHSAATLLAGIADMVRKVGAAREVRDV